MDGALVHHTDELEVVRDDDDCGALLVDALEQLHDADGVLVVEVAGRLICDQNLRTVDQCAGDGGTLLLATAELARIGIVLLAETDAFEHLRDICADFRSGFTGDQLGEADVLIDGTVLEEPEVLEDDTESATVLRDETSLHVLQGEPVDADLALRRLELLREEADERGFTDSASNISTSGNSFFGQWWATAIGAKNVGEELDSDKSTNVNMEQIYKWNPDFIFITNFNTAKPDDIYNNTVGSFDWSGIKAVKDKNVYKMPLGMYRTYTAGVDTPITLLWLAKATYPERFEDIDITAKTKEYYGDVFGITLTDEQSARIFAPLTQAGKLSVK